MEYQFHDVFGLDRDLLAMVPQPCIALLLLFPINEKVHLFSLCTYIFLFVITGGLKQPSSCVPYQISTCLLLYALRDAVWPLVLT